MFLKRNKKQVVISRNIVLCILLILAHKVTFAQVDTTYVGIFERNFMLRAYTSQKATSLSYELSGQDNEMIYKPNNLVEFGVGATWKFLSVDFGYGLNLSRNEEKGNTDYFDFQFHYYGRRLMFDIFLQNYTGFYLWDIETEKIYGIRPDLSVFQVGFLGEYLFNGKKFSSSAAFNQEEWQKKSAGSLLLGIGAYYSKISADSSFVLNSEIKDRQTSRGFQFGPSIGYAYTWVMKENFFVTVSMSIGVHVGFGTINGKRKTEVFPTVYPRLSAGYNGDKWALSLSFQNNSIYTSNPEAAEMNLDIAEFKLVYSRRFSFYPEIKNKTLKRLFK